MFSADALNSSITTSPSTFYPTSGTEYSKAALLPGIVVQDGKQGVGRDECVDRDQYVLVHTRFNRRIPDDSDGMTEEVVEDDNPPEPSLTTPPTVTFPTMLSPTKISSAADSSVSRASTSSSV